MLTWTQLVFLAYNHVLKLLQIGFSSLLTELACHLNLQNFSDPVFNNKHVLTSIVKLSLLLQAMSKKGNNYVFLGSSVLLNLSIQSLTKPSGEGIHSRNHLSYKHQRNETLIHYLDSG